MMLKKTNTTNYLLSVLNDHLISQTSTKGVMFWGFLIENNLSIYSLGYISLEAKMMKGSLRLD